MPRKIVTRDGQTYRVIEVDMSPLGPKDVRVQVQFAAPKHGTESHILSGSAFDRKRFDPELRMFIPAPETTEPPKAPGERGIGNMVVGIVAEVGAEATLYQPGDKVFGYGQIMEFALASEDKWYPLGSLTPEDAVCVDPAHVAFVAVRDGNIRIGDDVAIFGLGAIGLMAVQIVRAGGAQRVFAVDPIAVRREVAAKSGAVGLDPTACDAGLEIKRATGNKGVDVSIETSGNGRALHEAIRCIRQCGTVVHVPWGPKDASPLHLDEEFHLNRPTLIGSQAWEGWGNPDRGYPLWTWERAYQATIALFRARLITGVGVVHPIVPFDEAAETLKMMIHAPEKSVKIGITFP